MSCEHQNSSHERRTQRLNAHELRCHILRVLQAADGPLTTAQLRDRISTSLGRTVVIETVYRALAILADRGAVRRTARSQGRHTRWVVADAALVGGLGPDIAASAVTGSPNPPAYTSGHEHH